ncbi:MAG: flagellar biosynthesis protein FlgG [Candidatus Hydrogenedens sp.]|nr:flagellar biosynthesis protein FlgG [Candidatus Hydrogenedens sp.]
MNFNAAISGIRNALFRQGVTANNVANVNTPGYRARQVINAETASGGVGVGEVRESTAPGSPDILQLSDAAYAANAGSNVDLAEEQINTLTNAAQLRANVSVLKVQDDALGAVLDIKR